MKIIVKSDYLELSKTAANIVRDEIKKKPNAVLGLPTGSTPIGMYKELIRMHKEEGMDFSGVTTFNLDEYYGISYESEQSYHYFMHRNFFDHVNISPDNINIPEANTDSIEKECKEYDNKIREFGGIDLMILGIGKNGHIGFNEPGDEMEIKTHIADLTEETIKANARFFEGYEMVPQKAVTMGLEGIMNSKKILLLASGEGKAEIIGKLLESTRVSTKVPASFLHLHNNVIIAVTEDAAKLLRL